MTLSKLQLTTNNYIWEVIVKVSTSTKIHWDWDSVMPLGVDVTCIYDYISENITENMPDAVDKHSLVKYLTKIFDLSYMGMPSFVSKARARSRVCSQGCVVRGYGVTETSSLTHNWKNTYCVTETEMLSTGLYQWQVNNGSCNGLVSSGNKPLPEPMLTQICVATWRH